MPDCLFKKKGKSPSLPIHAIAAADYESWLDRQSDRVKAWLDSIGFKGKAGRSALMPGDDGRVAGAVMVRSEPPSLWDHARLQKALPSVDWHLSPELDDDDRQQATLGWALAGYRFDRYKKDDAETARLLLGDDPASAEAGILADAIYLGRDLVNTPANDMGPAELEGASRTVAERFGAEVRTIEGDALLDENFPAVHTVGRASDRAPRVIDLTWGDADAPKLTLVGKGVCFDTGGLDLKPRRRHGADEKRHGRRRDHAGHGDGGDGAGPAHPPSPADRRRREQRQRQCLPAGRRHPDTKGPLGRDRQHRCRRPPRAGRSPGVGRRRQARPDDRLRDADRGGQGGPRRRPPCPLHPDDRLAADLLEAGENAQDPLWRLPLHKPYRDIIDSPIADINNAGAGGMAGTITAALFLKDFVTATSSWAHLDIYGWTPAAKPGRPKGGEATALRALVSLIKRRFGKTS